MNSNTIKTHQESIAPTNEILVSMFSAVLKVENIGVQDNFFSVGGHSLLAVQLIAKIRKELKLELTLSELFLNPSVEKLQCYLKEKAKKLNKDNDLAQITAQPDEKHNSFTLNLIQQAYYVGKHERESLGSTSCLYYEFECENINVASLEKAWNKLIQRHDMLRCVFAEDMTQKVLKEVPYLKIEKDDFSGLSEEKIEENLDKLRQSKLNAVHAADQWPLVSLEVYRLAKGKICIQIYLDALACDLTSSFVFFNDLECIYNNQDESLAPLMVTFKDYLSFESKQQKAQNKHYVKSVEYWNKRLGTLPNGPKLPLTKNNSSPSKPMFTNKSFMLTEKKWRALQDRVSTLGITENVLLLTFYAKVVATWANNPHFSLTIPLCGRDYENAPIADVIGTFTSGVLLEVNASSDKSLSLLSKEIQTQLFSDLDRSDVHFLEVLRDLRSMGQESHMPIVFTSKLGTGCKSDNKWLGKKTHHLSQTAQVWINNQISEVNDGVLINWSCLENFFEENVLESMFEAYVNLIGDFVDSKDVFEEQNFSVVPDKQLKIRDAYNKTKTDLNKTNLLSQFMRTAMDKPLNEAIITPSRTISYKELHNASSQIANFIELKKYPDNKHVAIFLPKGWEQIAGVMGCGYAGATYLPIDIATPKKRIEHILKAADVDLVITIEGLLGDLSVEKLDISSLVDFSKDMPEYDVKVKDDVLAYTIFTSGSTGNPKGVMLTHKSVCNTIMDVNKKFSLTEKDKLFAVSSLNFDLSVFDIYGALCVGAGIIIPDEKDRKDARKWLQFATEKKVTVWNSVPAIVKLLCDEAEDQGTKLPESLRLVMMSGDFVPVSLVQNIEKLGDNCEIISLGGATEGSIWSIYYPIVDVNMEKIPYGYPLGNQEIHILDEQQQICPDFVNGDIYIKGEGVAKGYLNDKAKTDAQFVVDKVTKEIIYKTGDIGYFNAKGYVEIIGRVDAQVKVQGYRVELGEVEQQLLLLEEVKECAVIAKDDANGHKILVAYILMYVDIDLEILKNKLSESLPNYMIPSVISRLDKMPLSANGKVDKKALANIEVVVTSSTEFVAPTNETQRTLAGIFSEVLNIKKVGVHDDFFELGGHSLLATALIRKINKAFEKSFSLATLFTAKTVKKLEELIEENTNDFNILVPIQTKGQANPIFAVPGAGGTAIEFYELSKSLGNNQPFYAFQSVGFHEGEAFLDSIEEIALENIKAMKSHQPEGPYHLIGYSLGAFVAYEMIRIMGDENNSLLVLDIFTREEWENVKKAEGKFKGKVQKGINRLNKMLHRKHVITEDGHNVAETEMQINNEACLSRYQIQKLTHDVHFSVCWTEREVKVKDKRYGWQKVINNKVLTYQLAGGHLSILRAEYVSSTAATIKKFYEDIK